MKIALVLLAVVSNNLVNGFLLKQLACDNSTDPAEPNKDLEECAIGAPAKHSVCNSSGVGCHCSNGKVANEGGDECVDCTDFQCGANAQCVSEGTSAKSCKCRVSTGTELNPYLEDSGCGNPCSDDSECFGGKCRGPGNSYVKYCECNKGMVLTDDGIHCAPQCSQSSADISYCDEGNICDQHTGRCICKDGRFLYQRQNRCVPSCTSHEFCGQFNGIDMGYCELEFPGKFPPEGVEHKMFCSCKRGYVLNWETGTCVVSCRNNYDCGEWGYCEYADSSLGEMLKVCRCRPGYTRDPVFGNCVRKCRLDEVDFCYYGILCDHHSEVCMCKDWLRVDPWTGQCSSGGSPVIEQPLSLLAIVMAALLGREIF